MLWNRLCYLNAELELLAVRLVVRTIHRNTFYRVVLITLT